MIEQSINVAAIQGVIPRLAKLITDDNGLAWIDAVTGKHIVTVHGARDLVVCSIERHIRIEIDSSHNNGGLASAIKYAQDELAAAGYTTEEANS